MKYTFIIIFFSYSTTIIAQDFSIDSLERLPIKASDHPRKADVYWKLGSAYRRVNIDSSLKYSTLAIQLGGKYNLREALAWGYLYAGNALGAKGFYDSCISYERKGINLLKQLNKKESLARGYCIIGGGFSFRAVDDSSIYYFQKSIENGKPYGYVEGYVGLAKIYNRTRNYESGLLYSKNAYRESGPGEIETKIRAIGMMGEAYNNLSRPDTALKLMNEALRLSKKYRKDVHIGNFAEIIAGLFIDRNDFDSAKPLALEAYEMSKKTKSRETEASSLMKLGEIAFAEGDNQQAKARGLQAFALAKKENIIYLMQWSSLLLMKTYARMGDLPSTRLFQSQFVESHQADIERANSNAIIDYKIKYETLQKEQENAQLKNRQLQIEATVQRQKAIVLIACMTLTLLIITGAFGVRAYQTKRRMNKQLELKNSAILSINKELESRQAEITIQKNEIEKQREGLTQALMEREKTQSFLVHSEKMASLGQLMAGIAHELNNPITFISAGTQSLKDRFREIKDMLYSNSDSGEGHPLSLLKDNERKIKDEFWHEIEDLFKAVLNGAERSTSIVNSLRTFSYENQEGIQQSDLIECIEATLTMLQSEIKNRIEIRRDYQPIPLVECNIGEISQVLMNVLANAVQAIPDQGHITIKTGVTIDKLKVVISIKDSGQGIPKNVLKRVFDPFFTTKPLGRGTGLGLSISHKIMEKHHGRIHAFSEPGKGAEFIINMPIS